MGVEGEEGADAVGVGPVEQEMAEQGDEREAIEETPSDGRGLFALMEGLLVGLRAFSAQAPAMVEPYETYDYGCFEWQADEGVGPAAMMLEVCDGAANQPQSIEVGSFGGQGHREGGVGGLAVEAGAGEDGTGHEVGDGFHVCCDVSLSVA